MSQYPAPYSPPPHGYPQQTYWDPTRDLLAPARRASVFMFVYGGILLLCGGCTLLGAGALTSPETVQRTREMFPSMEVPSPRDAAVRAMVPLVMAVLLIALGAWVRTGRRAAVITTLVLAGIVLAFESLNFLATIVRGADAPTLIGTACGSLLFVVAPLALLLVWLIQALRNSGQIDGAQAYARQYWQYVQQYQQGHGQGYPQGAYGQGAGPYAEGGMIPAPPPPPPPPPSAAPPADPQSPA